MATRRIVPLIQTVDLPAGIAGPEPVSFDVRSFLIADAGGVLLVDTGLEADTEPISAALSGVGATWDDVTDVVLTHAHPDHTGAATAVSALSPKAIVWGGQGDRFPVPVRPADDGAIIRGLSVVSTPGHTPEHLSLLDEAVGVLFAGDAVASVDCQLTLGPEPFIADRAEAIRSLHRLADLKPGRVVFSHGAEVEQPADALVQFIRVCG